MTELDLGIALGTLGRRTHNAGALQQALICVQNAQPVFQDAGMAPFADQAGQLINRSRHELGTDQNDGKASKHHQE